LPRLSDERYGGRWCGLLQQRDLNAVARHLLQSPRVDAYRPGEPGGTLHCADMNYAVRSGNFSAARFVVSDMKHVSAAILAALAMVTSSGCGSDPEEVTATATEATAISGPTSPQTTSSAEVVGWAPILYATPRADDRLLL